jgi:hypothetical protein
LVAKNVSKPDDFTHKAGRFQTQRQTPLGAFDDEEKLTISVMGILLRENALRPDVSSFALAATKAEDEYFADAKLFNAVLDILTTAGTPRSGQSTEAHVYARQVAEIVKRLREQDVQADDPQLDEVVTGMLVSLRAGDLGTTASLEIELPPLDDDASVEIIETNLHAMQGLYFVAMLEELKLFQVVDKLIQLFHAGLLPLSDGPAGKRLFALWKDSDERLTEIERRNLYERAFGFPGGDPQNIPNREFNDLWPRFISAVSSHFRQLTVEKMLRPAGGIPIAIGEEQVRKAGRDLAGNLSVHGYGSTIFLSKQLTDETATLLDLCKDPEIQNAFGAKDMWQVIEQVATLELGGARNTFRYRTMAQSGAVIVRWLANRAQILCSLVPLFADGSIQARTTAGKKATSEPKDFDLVNACEQWLAVTGTPELQVEQNAQPAESPLITSRPIQIPAAAAEARDWAESIVSSSGLSYNGGRNGRRNGQREAVAK